MLADWHYLSNETRFMLARAVMQRAIECVLAQALSLAQEIEAGMVPDRGGPDALRMLVEVVRESEQDPLPTAGHC
jgi:hypothetical protein